MHIKTAFMFGAILLYSTSFCQDATNQHRIIVKSFNYVWDAYWQGANNSDRVILFKDSAYQSAAKKSFISAFKEKWVADVPDFDIEVKKLPGLSNRPKFKTKLKSSEPGAKYAFVQVFDKGGSEDYRSGTYTMHYETLFRLISGQDQSVVTDRTAFIKISQPPILPGQIIISRLPGHPGHFMHLIDSIAHFALDTGATRVRDFEIRSAYVYDKMQLNRTPKQKINSFPDSNAKVRVEQVGKRRNVGGNSVAGALTLLTGIRTDKVKRIKYFATHSYHDESDTVHVEMNYTEEQRTERERVNNHDGSKSLSEAGYISANILDKEARNFILRGTDTLGFYKVSFEQSVANWTQMWDGVDSSSISMLPAEWNNGTREMTLTGKINNQDFSLVTIGNGNIWKFILNVQHVANMYGKEKIQATLFDEMDNTVLNVMALLCKVGNYYLRYG